MRAKNRPTNNSFTSRHFQLEKLAEGVYSAINAEEGWAICNAGIIDLGDRTIVYDAFSCPQAASDLQEAAETLTGRPVRMLINSHYHNDHIWGNQAFGSEVDIVSSMKTRQLILTEGAAEVKWYSETAQDRLETLEKQYTETVDEAVRRQLKPAIYDYQAILAALPILQVRPPNLTFTGELLFNGPKRSARLITYDNAHCGSDTILYLPEDGIVFMEDTLFIDCHPYLADGDPVIIQHVLADVKSLQPSVLVPGHGPVGTIEHLDLLDGYISALNTLVQEAKRQGWTRDDLVKIPVPNEYQHFRFAIFFTANLLFMYKCQSGL